MVGECGAVWMSECEEGGDLGRCEVPIDMGS